MQYISTVPEAQPVKVYLQTNVPNRLMRWFQWLHVSNDSTSVALDMATNSSLADWKLSVQLYTTLSKTYQRLLMVHLNLV